MGEVTLTSSNAKLLPKGDVAGSVEGDARGAPMEICSETSQKSRERCFPHGVDPALRNDLVLDEDPHAKWQGRT
jgi:hypothetical protein